MGGHVKWCSHFGKQFGSFSKTRKWTSNSIPRYLSKKNENISTKRLACDVHVRIFHNNQKVETLKCLLNYEWICKMWHIHVIHYSTIKRNEILIDATTRVNLENIMLSERSQTQKNINCAVLFTWNSKKAKTQLWWLKSELLLSSGRWGLAGRGRRGIFWDNENILYLIWWVYVFTQIY